MCDCNGHSVSMPHMVNNPRRMREYPFVRTIETEITKRIYTFCPKKDREFKIVLNFPIDLDEGNSISVVGENINPQQLKDAVSFVEKNERQFVDAFYSSKTETHFIPMEINEENFAKF